MEHNPDGGYALITGASEGLGKNMVIECAQRNMHIIAVALPGPELVSLKGLITHNFPVRVETIETDLSTEAGCKYVYETVRNLGVRLKMVINCAGISLTQPLTDFTPEQCAAMVRLNSLGTTLITRYFMADLLANAPSYLLNVSSLGSYFRLPNKQVYSSSKAYVTAFTRSLQTEFRHAGVSITVVCPGGLNGNIRSVLANNQGGWIARHSITSPEYVAKKAVRACFRGKNVVIPGRINNFFLFLNRIIPAPIKAMITTAQMNKLVVKKQE